MTNESAKPGSTRREFLTTTAALAGGGALACVVTTRPSRATPAAMAEAIRNVVGEAPIRSGKVKIDVPPLVENGNSVPVTITVESPMTAADHVRSIHLFNQKNPQ